MDAFCRDKSRKDGVDSRCKDCSSKYYKANKKRMISMATSYKKNRLATDAPYKITHNLSCRLRTALKGVRKSATTMKLLGCSPEYLRNHLEMQFTAGMSWKNYGLHGWHVDHIRPCSSFDMSDPKQQRKCFHYTNLQPLWAKDNLAKSNNIPNKKTNNIGVMKESQIESAVCKHAQNKGLLAYKLTSPGRSGVPDRLMITPDGKVFMIEFKTPTGRLSALQINELRRLSEHNIPVYVVKNVVEGIRIVDSYEI
mgnify:CR=1 FL=1